MTAHAGAAGWRGLRPLLPLAVPAVATALYGWAVFASTFAHPGSIGIDYIAPGTDWMVLYGAIRLAVAHQFALTLDGAGFTAYLNESFATWLPRPLFFRPWVYPPSLLVLLWPFAGLGFFASYVAFQAAGAALLAGSLLYRADQRWAAPLIAVAALACPAASIGVVSGQADYLVAGLLVLGFRLLPIRPWLAGAVLGLLTVKPQFGLLVPVALLAARQWRAIAGAAGSGLALAAASAVAFGPELWLWWLGQAANAVGDPNSAWTQAGRLWGNSVYACAVLLGVSNGVATLLQAGAILAAAACVYAAFRSRLGPDRTLAILLAAAVLGAPHSGAYDAILLAIAGGLWLADVVAPRVMDGIVVLVLWIAPFIGPPAVVPLARAMPLVVLGFILLALRPGPRSA